MNKTLKVILIIAIPILIIGGIIYFFFGFNKSEEPSYTITNDSLKFKTEYEALNGQKTSDGKTYLTMNLKSYNPFVYSNYEDIFKLLDSGTGIIYFGFPECPWCRNLVPVLSDAAISANVKNILYLNIRDDRDTKELTSKGKIKTTKEGTDNYNKLLKILNGFLPAYKGLNDDSVKRIYLPTVVFVKDGKVLGIEQSLEAFSLRVNGNPYLGMNADEKTALTNIFNDYFTKLGY